MKRRFCYLLIMSVFFFSGIHTAQAQSIKNIIKSTVGHFMSQEFTGTWNYEGVAVKFQSDNLLKKAGGNIAASKIENDIDAQLKKIGFESGITTFRFNEDSTFTSVTNGKKMSGKYSYNNSTEYITLKYLNHVPVKAKVSGSGGKMSFLFEASSFLSMITFLGSHSGVSVVKSITSIFKSYDGMMVGMEFKKEKN